MHRRARCPAGAPAAVPRHHQPRETAAASQRPAILLEGKNAGRVRFFGLPAGYEFATLVEDLVDVGRGQTGLADESRQQLRSIRSPVSIRVLVTPT